MNFDKYNNTLKYPEPVMKPCKNLEHATSSQLRAFADELEKYENSVDSYKEQLKEYHQEHVRLKELFKHDLFRELGIIEHPKREFLFEYAWRYFSCSGTYREVFYEASELTKLLS